jgi:hypothetical protein
LRQCYSELISVPCHWNTMYLMTVLRDSISTG